MSVTGIVVLLVYLGGLVMGLVFEPLYALFSYLWIFYNDPSTSWWGAQLPALRYSLMAAIVALLAALWRRGDPVSWLSHGASKIILGYAIWMWVQTAWAVDLTIHLDGAILFTKYAILSYVIYKTVADEKRIEWFLWAHIAGCTIFGWRAFEAEVVTRLETIGGPGVDDSNLLAAHMVTGLVAAGFMFIKATGYRRWLAFATLPFILNAVVLTQSRGGFLALIAAGLSAWYLSPKAYKRLVFVCGALAFALLLILSNEFFWERISTLLDSGSPNVEYSAEQRVLILGPQVQMFLDHPFGAGHRGNEVLSPQYMSTDLLSSMTGRRSAHNTFMAALVDQGFVGALLLLGLYLWGAWSFWHMKRLDQRGLPTSLGLLRAAVGAGLASLVVSGLFLNLLKTEVQIWMITLAAVLLVACNRAVHEHEKTASAATPSRDEQNPLPAFRRLGQGVRRGSGIRERTVPAKQ